MALYTGARKFLWTARKLFNIYPPVEVEGSAIERAKGGVMRDADIRPVLRSEMEQVHRGDSDTSILEELGLRQGLARVDLAVVNGNIHGFEIKSLADTLRRLPTQIEIYGQVFDFVTIVLAEQHRKDAVAMVPRWWGVTVAKKLRGDRSLRLVKVREARPNRGVDKRALVELLWHEETLALLRTIGADRGLRSKPRALAWDRLCEHYSLQEVSDAVRRKLKDRRRLPVELPPPPNGDSCQFSAMLQPIRSEAGC